MADNTALQSAPPPTAPQLPPLTQAPQQTGAFDNKWLEGKEKSFEDKSKSITDLVSQAQMPEPPKLDPMPQAKNTSPVEVWGSAAMAFALLGSMMTRSPMTTALNSAAGVMQAYQKGDQERANAEFERWKAQTDYALKLHDVQMDTYKTILEKAKVDQEGARSDWTAATAAYGDETARMTAQTQGWEATQRLMDDRVRWAAEQQKAFPELAIGNAKWNLLQELQGAQKELREAQQSGDQPKIAAAQKKLTDAHQDAKILVEAEGKTGATPRSAVGMALQEYLADPNNDTSPTGIKNFLADFNATQSEARAVGTRAGGVDIADKAVVKFADQVREVSNRIPRSDYPLLNRLIVTGQTQGGSPDMTRLLVAINGVVNERARAITGGAPHVADQEEGRKMLSEYLSKDQLDAGVDQMVKEVRAMESAAREAKDDVGGKKPLSNSAMDLLVKRYGPDGVLTAPGVTDEQATQIADYMKTKLNKGAGGKDLSKMSDEDLLKILNGH